MGNIYKDAIAKSFMELSKQKNVKDIRISDITQACGISRQTFYHHFQDKYSVMEYIYEPATKKLLEFGLGNSNFYEAFLEMFYECYNNKAYYMSLVSYNGQNSFEEYAFKGNHNFYTNFFAHKKKKDIAKSLEIEIDYACYGTVYTVINWIRTGMKETPEYMVDKLYKCLPMELRRAVEKEKL